MIKKSLATLFIFLVAVERAVAVVDYENNSTGRSTRYERGLFALGFNAGLAQPRLLNPSGTYTAYKGSTYGGFFDVQLWGAGSGEARAFAMYTTGSAKGISVETDRLVRSESLFGLKVYANPVWFLGAGIGNSSLKVSNLNGEQSISHQVTTMGMGFDLPMSESLFFSIQGWYKSGAIQLEGNSSLSSNSAIDSVEGMISIVWSPPAVTINVFGSK